MRLAPHRGVHSVHVHHASPPELKVRECEVTDAALIGEHGILNFGLGAARVRKPVLPAAWVVLHFRRFILGVNWRKWKQKFIGRDSCQCRRIFT